MIPRDRLQQIERALDLALTGENTILVHDHISAALSLVREELVREGDGWQPIETAPRDGTWVLIVRDEVYKAQFDSERELWFFDVDGCAVDPSHWQPIPAVPGVTSPPPPASDWDAGAAAKLAQILSTDAVVLSEPAKTALRSLPTPPRPA